MTENLNEQTSSPTSPIGEGIYPSTPYSPEENAVALFVDGHMAGRRVPIKANQDFLSFRKLEKPFLESVPELVVVDYIKISEDTDSKTVTFQLTTTVTTEDTSSSE